MGDDTGVVTLTQNGRVIRLDHLSQSWTYGGMMEGPPTSAWNRRYIERMQRNAARDGGPGFHLVPPTERPVEGVDRGPGRDAYMEMPAIQVRATFRSRDPIDVRSDAHGSMLNIVWFQHEWAIPIEPDVLEHLRGIDWNAEADDYEW